MPGKALLVTGCPRSGTSIVGEVLAAPPKHELLFEPSTMRRPGFGWQAWYEGLPEQRFAIVKAPFLWPRVVEVLEALPEMRVVWAARDARDVAASLWRGRQKEGKPWSIEGCFAYAQAVRRAEYGYARAYPWRFSALDYGGLIEDPADEIGRALGCLGFVALPQEIGFAAKRLVTNDASGYQAAGQRHLAHRKGTHLGHWQTLPEPQREYLADAERG